MTREIPLTRGAVALVDDADYEWLSRWKWFLHSQGYAVRNLRLEESPKRGIVYMHRVIVDMPNDTEIDHINRNRLDNRRSNLRAVTRAMNAYNTVARGGSSEYKGVHYSARINRWVAQITIDRRCTHLGCFKTEMEAAKAYDSAARQLHGEHAHLNFRDGWPR